MDPRVTCAGFTPPAPMQMSAYLDAVTQGKVKNVGRLSIFDLDAALDRIEARPSPAEQAALLSALDDRFVEFARPQGWLRPVVQKSDERRSDAVTRFVIEELLGLKPQSASVKVFGEFKVKLEELVRQGLNSQGRSSLKVLEVLYELSEAKSGRDVATILEKLPASTMSQWLSVRANWEWLAGSTMKAGKVSPVVRSRIVKLIAARLTWLEVRLARLAWVVPWLTALDVLLTSEQMADDETERRLGFLAIYGRLFARRSSRFAKLIDSCTGTEWRYRMAPPRALNVALERMR